MPPPLNFEAKLGSGNVLVKRACNHRLSNVFLVLGQALVRGRVVELAPQQLAAIVWACAAAGGASTQNKRSGGYRDPELLAALEGKMACRLTASGHQWA